MLNSFNLMSLIVAQVQVLLQIWFVGSWSFCSL